MPWSIIVPAAASLIGGVMSGDAQQGAANQASGAQQAAAQAGIAQQDKQFEALRQSLMPYIQGGTAAFGMQGDLAGANGAAPQKAAFDQVQQSPMFQGLLKRGENSILANASATGGLRGGNTQAALEQFSPMLLSQFINDQYSRLGGLSSIGENAAAMTGNAGMQNASAISALLGQQGSAQAGAALAGGKAQVGDINAFTGALGQHQANGGLQQLINYFQGLGGGVGFNSGGTAAGTIPGGAGGFGQVVNNPSAYVGGPF